MQSIDTLANNQFNYSELKGLFIVKLCIVKYTLTLPSSDIY